MMWPFLVYKKSKSNLRIHHRYLQSGPPHFHLICLTHSAMFLFVSSPALQSTIITYAKASSSSCFPNCDNHNSIPFQTTTTISQRNNLPSSCTTYIKSVSHSIFLLLPLLSYFGSYFFPHRSSERVGLSAAHSWSQQQLLYHIRDMQAENSI